MTDAANPTTPLSPFVGGAAAEPTVSRSDARMALFDHLAAVPVWRSSVEGGAARKGVQHVAGAARANPAGAAHSPPTRATVALADGTRITFATVDALEPV